MTAPIDLVDAVIHRLGGEVSDLAGAEDALQLADLLERGVLPQRFPHAFVLPVGDDAEANVILTGAVRQRVVETVGVLLIDKHAGERTGGKVRAALEPIKAEVREALVGWAPDPDYSPLELVRTRLVGLAGGAAFVQLDFRTAWHLRQTLAA